jgi:hypothetical protein
MTGCDSRNGEGGGGGNVAVSGEDVADFGSGARIAKTFNVGSAAEWDATLSSIANGGNDKKYIINITDGFSVAGSLHGFGYESGVKVPLRGEGKNLSLTSAGCIVSVGVGTVILRGLSLYGYSENTHSPVWVYGGDFIMQSGGVYNNASAERYTGNCGVGVSGGGTFIMNGGEISGNSSTSIHGAGGGVYVNYGAFFISNGIIYGSNEADADIRNTTNNTWEWGIRYAVLLVSRDGTAQYGTFSGDTWNRNGDLSYSGYTIKVVNGILQQQ